MFQPFTYLVKFTPSQGAPRFYYGTRYARDCRPEDLFQTYFTSSAEIHRLLKTHGLPCFQFEIRRRFTTAQAARGWEHKVLRRMKVVGRPEFINKAVGGAIITTDGMKGKHQSDFQKQRARESGKARVPWNKGKIGGCPQLSKGLRGLKRSMPSWNKGLKCPEHAARMSGENHPMFGKPGWVPQDALGRFTKAAA